MRSRTSLIVATALVAHLAGPAFAQNPQTPMAPEPEPATPSTRDDRLACPPGVDEREAPSLQGDQGDTTGSGKSLSRQLSDTEGVVCPPAHVDPGIVAAPPEGGALRVIPPPGSPGGDQSINPK